MVHCSTSVGSAIARAPPTEPTNILDSLVDTQQTLQSCQRETKTTRAILMTIGGLLVLPEGLARRLIQPNNPFLYLMDLVRGSNHPDPQVSPNIPENERAPEDARDIPENENARAQRETTQEPTENERAQALAREYNIDLEFALQFWQGSQRALRNQRAYLYEEQRARNCNPNNIFATNDIRYYREDEAIDYINLAAQRNVNCSRSTNNYPPLHEPSHTHPTGTSNARTRRNQETHPSSVDSSQS
jgi:hypothetical protein